MLVTVIVDGNNHNITKNGKRVVIQTELENGLVTLKKCQEITEKIRCLGHEPKKIHFMLSIFEEMSEEQKEDAMYGDYAPKCLVNKNAYYNVKENCLRIWQNGIPIYENDNGIICKDTIALADCLM